MSHTTKTNQILLIPATLKRQDDEALRRALESFGATLVGLSRGASQHQHLGYLLEGHCHWGRGWIVLHVICTYPSQLIIEINRDHHPSSSQSTQQPSLNRTWTFVDLIRFWILGSSLCNSASTGRGAGTTATGWGGRWCRVSLLIGKSKSQRVGTSNLTISLLWTIVHPHICLLHPPIITSGERWLQKRTKVWHWNIIRWVREGDGRVGWVFVRVLNKGWLKDVMRPRTVWVGKPDWMELMAITMQLLCGVQMSAVTCKGMILRDSWHWCSDHVLSV